MVEEGIAVFLLQRFYAKLLTIHHRTDTIVAALHAEHGKVVYLLAVISLQLVELIQRNGLGYGSRLLRCDRLLLRLLLLLSVSNTVTGHILQIIDDSHTMAVTNELGQILVQRSVLEVDIGNTLFAFFRL